jgi:hypothetical protein
MNYAKEFEMFMASLPDYRGVPVWDRFLCNFWSYSENGSDNALEESFLEEERFLWEAFVWGATPEGNQFWSEASRQWEAHLSALEEQ